MTSVYSGEEEKALAVVDGQGVLVGRAAKWTRLAKVRMDIGQLCT